MVAHGWKELVRGCRGLQQRNSGSPAPRIPALCWGFSCSLPHLSATPARLQKQLGLRHKDCDAVPAGRRCHPWHLDGRCNSFSLGQVELEGLTGHIEFNSKGQRSNYALKILQHTRSGFRQVRAAMLPRGWCPGIVCACLGSGCCCGVQRGLQTPCLARRGVQQATSAVWMSQ